MVTALTLEKTACEEKQKAIIDTYHLHEGWLSKKYDDGHIFHVTVLEEDIATMEDELPCLQNLRWMVAHKTVFTFSTWEYSIRDVCMK